MKNVFFLLAFVLLGLTACDKECDDPASENIIGTWNNNTNMQVEFQSNGTLIDQDDIILGIGDPDAEKTYSFIGSDTLSVTATGQGSTFTSKFGFENTSCDEIGLNFLGFTTFYTRAQ